MADDTTILTRRRVLGGIAAVGIGSAAAGAGTMALFEDTQNSTGNTVSAGTLDLEPAGSSGGGSFNISAGGLLPGEEVRVGYLDLANVGQADGELDYEITGWTDYENGRNSAEKEDDASGGDPGAGNGELSDVLELRAFVDRSPGNGTENHDSGLTSGWVGLSGGRVNTNVQLDSGNEIRIWIYARIPSGAGDEVQSDSVEVDAAFYLTQT